MRSDPLETQSSRVQTVVEALRLRRWSRFLLEGSPGPLPSFSANSLHLFLEAERCFLRLTQGLEASQVRVPASFESRLLVQAEEERIRVRSATRQLEQIAHLAKRHGWRVVVLKGGVSVLRTGQAVDMVDLDLLVPPAAAPQVAAQLDRVGYRVSGAGTPRHLATRSIEAELPIDIHLTLNRNGERLPEEVWQHLRPVASMSGLHVLSAPDHLWHLLDHVVNDHPERMGSTRELLLLKGAVAQCSDAEWRGILARIAKHPKRSVLTSLLEAARGESDGSNWSSLDRASAVAYAARLLLKDARVPEALLGAMYRWIFDVLLGGQAVSNMWELVWERPLGLSTIGPVAAVERRTPRLGRGVRIGVRAVGVGAAALAALPILVRVLRIVRDTERHLAGAD